MLAEARAELPPERALPGGLAFEQKPDGYRAVLFAGPGRAHLQSRNGADLSSAFPEITAAGRDLRQPLVLDGELVVATEGRLDFGRLQARARRRGAGARQAARTAPAHLIVFDVLDTADGPLLNEPYQARRALLEELFTEEVLAAPFVLCPATTDRATAEDWLDPAWGAAGIEGVVVKGLAQKYQPGRRGWIKVRARASAEAVVASVTGRVAAPVRSCWAATTRQAACGSSRGRHRCRRRPDGRSAACCPQAERSTPGSTAASPPVGAPARRSTTGRSCRRRGRVRRGHRGGPGPLPAPHPLPARTRGPEPPAAAAPRGLI